MQIDDMKAFLQAPLDASLTSALPKDDADLNRIVRPSLTYWQDAWIKLRKNKVAMLGLAIIALYLLLAIFAPMFSRYSFAAQDAKTMNQWPSAQHLFGTDQAGRDLWVRNWMGARVSLFIGIIVVLINTAIGCVVGGVSGYFGGKVDMLVMRLIDVLYGIPMIILAILIRTVMDSGIFPLVLAMVALGWISSARLVRGQVLQLKHQEFVMAARTLGVSDTKIIMKHMIPNIGGILITNMTMAIPQAIFTEAFLSFIGIGIKSPSCSWGSLAQSAIQVYRIQPYQLLIPAFFICTTMLSLNMLGDGLRDALDPRMRGR
jgi:oligopeptide transport system permease protein